MDLTLVRLSAAALIGLALAACGGDDGAQGPAGPAGAAGPPGPAASNAIVLTPNTPPDQFAALDMEVTVTSVAIASPPVVNFKIADRITGTAITGFGAKGKCFPYANTTTPYAGDCYPNLAFTLAKLVPASGGAPSKWVNYIVVAPPTVAANGTTSARALQTPGTESNGTLVDNGDGTYKYTFYNDVPGIAALVAGITPPAGSNKADLGDLTYDPNLTHRLVIPIAGTAPGTGSNNATGLAAGYPAGVPLKKAIDVIYDFVPATGKAPAASANRKMVANSNCESCHSTLGGIPGDSPESSGAPFHGGSRNDIEYCVICHTDQRRYGKTEAAYNAATRALSGSTYVVDGRTIGNAPNFLHKIHGAGVMTKTGYNYANVLFDKGGYSQDIRNCDKCHDSSNAATPQAALWKTDANRLACGSCHDGINFDTGDGLTLGDKAAGLTVSTGFFGKAHPANATDGTCLNSSCHNAGAPGDPDLVHKPVTPPSPSNSLLPAGTNSNTNAAWIASNSARLPTGAIKVEWDVKSVSLNASRNPVMVFRWLQNGTAVPILDFAAAPVNSGSQAKEMWADFMGSPSAYWVWSVPQDGIQAPVDFNASASVYLRSAWNGSDTGATLTGPDASGYYTVTKTNSVVPATARMLTGGMGYSYNTRSTLPLTQTNLSDYPVQKSTVAVTGNANTGLLAGMPNATGGLIVIAPNKQVVAAAGCVGSDYGCTTSGGFVARRAIVEDKRCNACHQELGTFTEDAFHAGQRNDGTTCSWCHTPNRASSGWTADSANFVHAIHAAAKRNVPYTWHAASADDNFSKIKYPGILARCEQCHVPGSYDFANSASANAVGLGTVDQIDKRLDRLWVSGITAAATLSTSPYVTTGTDFGAVGAGANLVTSPTATVCVSCHDSNLAVSHMKVNGGSLWAPRSVATATTEQCFVCHASGKLADVKAVHAR